MLETVDSAEQLFHHLCLQGGKALKESLVGASFENLFVDCKLAKEHAKASVNRGSLQNSLSKAISGFSNAAGGVIVWGVEAKKKRGTNADVVTAVPGVDDTSLLVTTLNELTPTAALPRNPAIRHDPLSFSEESGRGLVLSLIPQGTLPPYWSVTAQNYFIRVADSFQPMPHFQVADHFNRRRSPELGVILRFVGVEVQRDVGTQFPKNYLCKKVWVAVANIGRGTAHNVLVRVSCQGSATADGFDFLLAGMRTWKVRSGNTGSWAFVLPDPWHPSVSDHVAVLKGLTWGHYGSTSYDLTATPDKGFVKETYIPRLELEVAADDFPIRKAVCRLIPGASLENEWRDGKEIRIAFPPPSFEPTTIDDVHTEIEEDDTHE